MYKLCVQVEQSGLKMSLERAWDRTAALTGESRATAQRTAISFDRPGSNSNKSDSGRKRCFQHKKIKQRIGYTGSNEFEDDMSCYASTCIVK